MAPSTGPTSPPHADSSRRWPTTDCSTAPHAGGMRKENSSTGSAATTSTSPAKAPPTRQEQSCPYAARGPDTTTGEHVRHRPLTSTPVDRLRPPNSQACAHTLDQSHWLFSTD